MPSSGKKEKSTKQKRIRKTRKKKGNGINLNELLVSKDVADCPKNISGSIEIFDTKQQTIDIEIEEREKKVYYYLEFLQFKLIPYIKSYTNSANKPIFS